MLKSVDILLITLSSPIQIGIYEGGYLLDTISSQEKSSDVLPILFDEMIKKYNVEGLYFTNGPGSFMAIKVAYIFLKTISITKGIPLFATDAFKFNQNSPIKAIGKLYFVKVLNEIITQKLDSVEESVFKLPNELDYDEFSINTAPLYAIGAVG